MKIRITHTVKLDYEEESIHKYLWMRDADEISFREYIQNYFIADGTFCLDQRKETYLEECKHDTR